MAARWALAAAALLGLALGLASPGGATLLTSAPPEVAARLVGLDAIGPEHRPAVEELLGSDPLHILLTPDPFRTTPRVYDYLLERLPLAATMSRALKLGPYVVESVGPKTYWSTDQRGLKGTIDELVASDGRRVYLARGRYDGRWLKGLTGRAVIVLEYTPTASDDGQAQVANTIHCFVLMDDVLFQALARIIGSVMHGLMESKLDRALATARNLSEQVSSDPRAVYQALAETSTVTPAERTEFARWFLQP